MVNYDFFHVLGRAAITPWLGRWPNVVFHRVQWNSLPWEGFAQAYQLQVLAVTTDHDL